ncbi:MBL fold metallo-hydrolase [Anaerobacillus sp. MEB173]|uniref:MBL fold metallo-hydrolase n=1 Tax=Anaerobacillus sp. MEB173 TaxID=3383345 RepID=UPI003F92F01F
MQPLIEEIYPHIYKVSLSIPVPLKAVNIYLFKGSDGWSIVDCGFHDDHSEMIWDTVFKELNIDYDDVAQIVVTHYHPDHYGAAGWLQEITGAEVLLLDKEKEYLDLNWHDKNYPSLIKQFFLEHGLPENLALAVEDEHVSRYSAVSPHPSEMTLLSEGVEIQLGNYRFKTIWSPGHTEGLMTLWSESEAIFIANDLVLPKITPNISFHPNSAVNPLSDFLSSLRKIRELPAEVTLTGHRETLTNLRTRVDEIIIHHDHRFEVIKNILKTNQGCNAISAYQISNDLFGHLKGIVQQRFAFSETLSHLEYLVHANELKKMYVNEKYYYFI